MAWMKKKQKQRENDDREDYDNGDDPDEDDDPVIHFEKAKQKQNEEIKQEASKYAADNEVVAFAMPAREGLVVKNTNKVLTENLWEALAVIINKLEKIERRLEE